MKENLPLNLSSSLRRNIDGINQHAKFEQMKHPSLPVDVGKCTCKAFLLSKANSKALTGIFMLFSFFLFSNGLFAQGNARDNIRQKVALAKTEGKVFEQVKLFDDNSKSGVQNFLAQVSKGVTFDINTQLTADFLKNKFEQVTLEIPGAQDSGPMLLELVRSKVLANDFNLFTSSAPKVPVAYEGGIHYQGVVAGSPETLVAISVFPEMVMGLIVTKKGNYNLGRIEGQNKKHILFLNADLNEDEQFICGTVDDGINYTSAQLANNPSSFVNTCPVRVYVEVDNSVYLGWSSNLANTTNFVTGLFNQSFVLYANENIGMVMSELVIWTTADPYTSGTTNGQLSLFQGNTGAFNGDIGHLISNQNIGGLAAGFAGLCNSNTDLSLCFSGLSGLGYSTVPTYSFNVFILTHEMGHLVGSRHTHACVWNGNGTAIDGCSGFTEGGCPVPGSPAGGGTIMSYCHNDPVGINFNLGFGTQPGNVIRNSVTNATCLNSCCVAPTITCPANISVNNTPGQCGANVTYPAATATGTPAPTITYSHASGSFFPVGTTTVTATATNTCGTETCTFNITVVDNQFPVITCPFNITVNNDPGICGAVVNYNQPSATDNCGTGGIPTSIPGYTYKGTFGSHSYFVSNSTAVPEVAHAAAIALGGHLVTIASAAENAFVSAMRPETMWIGYTDRAVEGTYKWITNEPVTYTNWAAGEPNDYPNPGIPHEEDWAVINWTGGGTWNDWFYNISTYYVVEFEGGTIPTTLVSGGASGSVFPVGTTTVTYQATDASGNTSTCSFTITVNDVQPPVITCPANITQANDPNTCGAVVNFNVTATDNCGSTNLVVNGGFESGLSSWIVTSSGNATGWVLNNGINSFPCSGVRPPIGGSFDVVSRQTGPGLNLLSSPMTLPAVVSNAIVSWKDRIFNCGGVYQNPNQQFRVKLLTTANVLIGTVYQTNPGDALAQIGPNPRSFNVTGLLAPFAGQAIRIQFEEQDNLGFFNVTIDDVSLLVAGSGSTNVVSTPPSGSVFPVGTTTVTNVATDAAGNTSSCSFTVTVVDNQPPVITTCAANKTSASDAGLCTKAFTAAEIGLPTASDNCSYVLTWSRSDGAPNLADPFPFGITTITWTATDPAGLTATCTQTININLITTITTVTVTPNSQQYSDRVTFVATVTPSNCAGAGPIGGTVTFKIGALVMGTAPVLADGTATLANIALLEPTLDPGNPPNGPLKPGVKTVTAVYSGTDPDYIVSNPTTSLTITCEDARAYYTGACYASTASPTSSNAIVTLSATIKDISATPDAAGDVSSGDIRNATVTFINRDNNTVIATVPVGLVNPGDLTVGTATYNWNVTITGDAQQFTIGIIVNNYYCRNSSDDNTVVTVAKPLGDLFISGGGYLVLTNSAGIKAGTAGTKNNFGFNVKYNRARTNLQGNINTIVRRMEGSVMRVYQIKGNVMTSLVVSTTCPKTAIFNGKANIKDITDPLAPISVDGNATLQVKMTDKGEPGSEDSIAITLWDKDGGLWFASKWNGTTTVKQVLGGGNLKVHGGGSCDPNFADPQGVITEAVVPEQVIISETGDFKATANPNPSHGAFNIQVKSKSNEPIVVRLMDVNGNIKEVRRVFTKTSTIKMGEGLISGTYFAEVTQGVNKQIIKLIKLN